MRALVTGATGFVGSHVVRELLAHGWTVRALHRPGRAAALEAAVEAGPEERARLEPVEGDLLDRASLERAVAGCDAAFHVAAEYALWSPDPAGLARTNVEGTRNVLAACAAQGAARVVYTSSVACIGEAPPGGLADEETPLRPDFLVGPYERSKAEAEAVAREAAARGQHVVIVNPATVIGPGDRRPTPTGKIITDFLAGRIPATLDTSLTFVDVRDVAAGHRLALERGQPGRRYILANLQGRRSLAEFLALAARACGRAPPRLTVPYAAAWVAGAVSTWWADHVTGRPPGIPLDGVRLAAHRMAFDASRAVAELGLPQTPLEVTVRDAVAWAAARAAQAGPAAAGPAAALARLAARRPAATLLATAAVTALAAGLAGARLGFKTARVDLIGDAPFVRDFAALEAEFGDLDALVALAEGEPARARAFALALAARAEADRAHFQSVFARVDPAALGGRGLLWLDAPALEAAADAAARAAPRLAVDGPLAGAFGAAAEALRARVAAGGAAPAAPAAAPDPVEAAGRAVSRLLDDAAAALDGRPPPTTPVDALVAAQDAAGFTTTADGRGVLVLAQAREAAGDLDPRAAAVRALRAHVAALAVEFPDVRCGVTGKPVLQVDEMATYQADSTRSSLLALALVAALLALALRRLAAPLLVAACLALAAVWTLGGAAVWPGHLNLLAVVFVVVVIGLGVDYGLHLVIRMDELRREGLDGEAALAGALRTAGAGILASAATTVVGFLACLAAGFQGLREFGAVAAMGVVAALATMTTTLPALVLLVDRRRPPSPGRWRSIGPLARLDAAIALRPGRALAVALAACAAVGAFAPRVGWDGNLLRLQDPTLPSVQLELRLLEDPRLTSAFLAVAARDLDALRAAHAAVAGLPTVARAESVLTVLPADQAAKLPALARLAPHLASLAGAPPPSTPAGLRAALDDLVAACEEAQEGALRGGRGEDLQALEDLRGRAEALRARLAGGDAALAAPLADYDRRVGLALARAAGRLTLPPGPPAALGPADLPAAVRERLVGRTGAYLLRVHPRAGVWDDAALAAFVGEVRGALPGATGVPLLTREAGRLMVEGYVTAGWAALALVAACLLVHFRRLADATLALATLLLGGLVTAGVLGLLGRDLDPANLVALPMLVGIGIDAAVHVIERARAAASPGALAPHRVLATGMGRAVVYSSLTTVAGFGALLASNHPGTAGIGLTISVGVLACLLVSLTVPAAWIAWRASPVSPAPGGR